MKTHRDLGRKHTAWLPPKREFRLPKSPPGQGKKPRGPNEVLAQAKGDHVGAVEDRPVASIFLMWRTLSREKKPTKRRRKL